MYNLGDDNELDEISREAAGRYDAPGNPSWENLERELDKVLPVATPKRRRFFLGWWLVPLLLTGIIAGYLLLQQPTGHQSLQVTSATEDVVGSPVRQPVNSAVVESAKKQVAVEIKASSQQPLRTVTSGKNDARLSFAKSVGLSTNKNKISGVPRGGLSVPVDNIPTVTNNGTAANTKINIGTTDGGGGATAIPDSTHANAMNVPDQAATTAQSVPVADTSKLPVGETAPTVRKKAGFPAQKKLSFSVVGGVDMSTVKFRYADDAGFNVGALLGFHINDRWSFHSGAIFTHKNYKLAGPDFTAPKGTAIATYKLETVEGYCRMWEVPILARYAFASATPSHFFVGGGISSYFMNREKYTYDYYYNGQPATRTVNYHSAYNHFFAIVDLSAGLERRISKNFSTIIEPYAKIPLIGMGWGSIKLSSFGLNFAVQYRQSRKK